MRARAAASQRPPADPILKEHTMSKDKQKREAKKPKKEKVSKAPNAVAPRPLVTPISPAK